MTTLYAADDHVFTTFSGKRINFAAPEESDFDISDIAHALSRIPRYGGHLPCEHYSVGQHSVLVARAAQLLYRERHNEDPPKALLLRALLHDAQEAYLGDVVSPLKGLLPEYKALEAKFEAALAKHFCITDEYGEWVAQADSALYAAETHQLRGYTKEHFDKLQNPMLWDRRSIVSINKRATAEEVKAEFLECYGRYKA